MTHAASLTLDSNTQSDYIPRAKLVWDCVVLRW